MFAVLLLALSAYAHEERSLIIANVNSIACHRKLLGRGILCGGGYWYSAPVPIPVSRAPSPVPVPVPIYRAPSPVPVPVPIYRAPSPVPVPVPIYRAPSPVPVPVPIYRAPSPVPVPVNTPVNCQGYYGSPGTCSSPCGGGTQIVPWLVTQPAM